MARILLAEDNDAERELFQAVLEADGHEVVAVADGEACLRLFEAQQFDAYVLDVLLPEMDGIELLRRLRGVRPTAKVVVISGGGPSVPPGVALDLCSMYGAEAALHKPFDNDRLAQTVRQLVTEGAL